MKTNKNGAIKISGVDAEYNYLDNLLGDWRLVELKIKISYILFGLISHQRGESVEGGGT